MRTKKTHQNVFNKSKVLKCWSIEQYKNKLKLKFLVLHHY